MTRDENYSSSQPSDNLSSSHIILAGREDGSIDLFLSNEPLSLHTWELSHFKSTQKKASSTKKKPCTDDPVVAIEWLAGRCSAFAAFTASGDYFVFDLLVDVSTPICRDSLHSRVHSSTSSFVVYSPLSILYLILFS